VENDNSKGGYETGYGRPPRRTQFQKGRSGNSRGRPRGAKNVVTTIGEALREPVVINENGRRKMASKMDVIFKQVVNKAAKGDHRSIQLVIAFLDKHPLIDRESTRVTSEELLKKETLLRDAVHVLAKLGVPGAVDAVDEAARLKIAAREKGPKSS
jgi:hypothetical protein